MDSTYIIISLLSILIYVIYRFVTKGSRYWRERGVPSSNCLVPYIGDLWPVLIGRKCFGDVYKDIYDSAPKASMIGLWNVGKPELLLRDPELVKIVQQSEFSNFQENVMELDPTLDPLVASNPFFLSGEEWKKQRIVLTNSMSTAKLKNMAVAVNEVCKKFSTFLRDKIRSNNGIFVTEAQPLFARFTAEVVASVGFGVDGRCFSEGTGTFQKMGEGLFDQKGFAGFIQLITILFPSLASITRLRFTPKATDEYFRGVVKEVLKAKRKSGIRGNDFIQQLYDLYKSEDGEIDENFVASHAFSFFVDGYLTSSFTLGFVAYEIAAHTDVQEKLRQEVKKVLQQHGGEINYETIQDMKYMDQVIKESQRLLPVVSVLPKKCTERTKLIGSDGLQCILNPGDIVDICPLGLHKDPLYWNDPEVFDPERFSDEQKNDHQKFVYLPFGGGPRACPGMRMALLQMKGALTILLNNFSLKLSPKTQTPLTFDPTGFINTPRGGIWLEIEHHND